MIVTNTVNTNGHNYDIIMVNRDISRAAFLILNQKADFNMLLLHGLHIFSNVLTALVIAANLGFLFQH
jgi:hypothetical protein